MTGHAAILVVGERAVIEARDPFALEVEILEGWLKVAASTDGARFVREVAREYVDAHGVFGPGLVVEAEFEVAS